MSDKVRIHLLPSGKMPERKTAGAIVPGQSGNQLAYQMDPGESVLVGIGFITEMEWPMFYWVAPRSGLAAKWGITVTNAPGTVDPDYRIETVKSFEELSQTLRGTGGFGSTGIK